MKKSVSVFLILSLIISQFSIFVPSVLAVSSPWAQSDWSTGNYASKDSNVVTSTPNQLTLSTTERLTNTAFTSNNTGWSIAAVNGSTTPAGWVVVPGNSIYSTTDFLAMKYEAKCATVAAPTVGLTSPDNPVTAYHIYSDVTQNCVSPTYQVTSVASGYPIANVSQTNAITRCSTVTVGGALAHLITNNEWQTVARNAEAQAGNWSLGAVGSGYLFAGHNDNAPALAVVASTTDTGNNACAYTDTAGTTEAPSPCPTNTANNTSGTVGNQKRVLTMSNGSYIWDIAGNVWDWTNNTILINDQPVAWNGTTDDATGFGWSDYASGSTARYIHTWKAGSIQQVDMGPSNTSYNARQGIGRIYHYSNPADIDTAVYAFVRGGNWSSTSSAGAFAARLAYTPVATNSYVGFRCASDPVAISQSFSSSSGRFAAGGDSVTVGAVSDAKLYQSVNVGDTSTYNLSAYVYNNTAGSVGGTVDATVASLYYGEGTITDVSYTAVAGETGWYKLTGTVSGIASTTNTGLVVKSGKAVVVDDMSLNDHTNGTLTSSIFDAGYTATWGTLTYAATTPAGTTATVKVRTGNASDLSDATAFASCTAITSGSAISANACGSGTKRYGQYLVTLASTTEVSTPTFTSYSAAFSDTTASAGGSITYTDGTYTPPSVSLTVSDGTASSSGINTSTRVVQRKSATLSGDTCGSYGSFSVIGTSGTYPNFIDNGIGSGNCYQYEYQISDNLGNQATYTSSSVVKVLYPPSGATSCSEATPAGISPWLYEANASSGNSITLRFTNWQTSVDHFALEYGTQSNKYTFGVNSFGNKDTNSYTVNLLLPSTTYYFRVRAGNGCATGSWSNELSAKTLGLVSTNNLNIVSSELNTVNNPAPTPTSKTKTVAPTHTPAPATASGYDVKVKVVDTKKNPVEGATVTLHSTPQTAKTDKNGIADFQNVEAGDHKVLIAYSGYSGEQSINLTGNVKEFDLNVTVQKENIFLNPYVLGISGIMGVIIIVLGVLLIKAKRKIKKIT